jgi:hypothetical protein
VLVLGPACLSQFPGTRVRCSPGLVVGHMPNRPAAFRQADLTRALRAVKAAGVNIARIEIDPGGRIIIIAAGREAAETDNPLDRWMASRALQT